MGHHHAEDATAPLPFVSHMIAGAMAGTMEHIAMYPVDTIKTRMQALSHPGQRLHGVSVYNAINTAIRREGLRGLYKGVGAVAAGAGPAHALQFAVYEAIKDVAGGNQVGITCAEQTPWRNLS
ncbi:mitochondrial carrier protein-domain-containing protein [Dunaliella salina]|uniref:Mitochondrial carrier protein-domain-containing protein n=1 Tax=Dunaliella salina TaxID=3046 RepID=A0ABQ7FZ76_DUNSA|nr:mitochondrial carrier protein-domain-containing protein [Dunaliella salina]|eukprot:KAF5843670.1 mitochondrial carrier protein-domain-containing protein [Dunaliella salina]